MLERREDMDELKAGFRLSRELLQQPALATFAGREIFPGKDIESDPDLEAWIRATTHSSYHPCGTCKMGQDDLSVVSPECKVRGISRLRVADASIMPVIPSGNLNCPTMMIGERAADLIAGKPPLPPENHPYFIKPDWKTNQR